MEGLEAAALFAEISIAITGFITIFVALGSRDESFPVADHIVLKSLLGVSLACTAGGLTPVIISQFTSDSVEIWRISSMVGMLFSIILNVWLSFIEGARHRRVTGETLKHSAIEITLGLSTLVLYGINLSPVLGPPSSGPYLLALFLGLVICAQAFAKSLFRRFLS